MGIFNPLRTTEAHLPKDIEIVARLGMGGQIGPTSQPRYSMHHLFNDRYQV